MSLITWFSFLLTLAITPAADVEPAEAPVEAPEQGVVAMVNGQPVYFEDLEARLGDMHSGQQATTRGSMDLDRLMYRLVNDALLGQEARALGLENEPPIPERVNRLRRRLAVERLDQEEVISRSKPTNEEIRAFFDDQYRTVTLRMATAYEKKEADEIVALLQDEDAEFGAIAKEHSVDPYSARGGLVENLDRIDMPKELVAAAFDAEPQVLQGPVRTSLGWSVIRVESVKPADPERWEQLEDYIRGVVAFRKAETARAELSARLKDRFPAKINQEVLDSLVCERLPDGRLMPKVDNPKSFVVGIGEQVILAEELGKALGMRWSGVRNEEAALAAKPIVLDKLIGAERMWAEAQRRGYADSEPVRRAVRSFETNQIVPRFLDQVVGANVDVTDEEIQEFYQENIHEFPRPPRLHLGQITVADLAQAEQLIALLKEGADLAWLARQHSIDRFKESGGDRGWMVPTAGLDEIQDALYSSKQGDIFGPYGFEGNYNILKVNAREEQGNYDVGDVSERIRGAIYMAKFERALDETLRTLRSRSEIVINEDVLASLQIAGQPVEETGGSQHGMPPANGEH